MSEHIPQLRSQEKPPSKGEMHDFGPAISDAQEQYLADSKEQTEQLIGRITDSFANGESGRLSENTSNAPQALDMERLAAKYAVDTTSERVETSVPKMSGRAEAVRNMMQSSDGSVPETAELVSSDTETPAPKLSGRAEAVQNMIRSDRSAESRNVNRSPSAAEIFESRQLLSHWMEITRSENLPDQEALMRVIREVRSDESLSKEKGVGKEKSALAAWDEYVVELAERNLRPYQGG